MNKIIVAFCEGMHDISFLKRILLCYGFEEGPIEVDKIIEPFDKRFETEIKKTKIRIGFQNYYKVPNLIMKKENTWIFFHNMEGDSKKDGRREVKDMYLELTGFYNEEEDDFSFNFSCRFLYFFDADDEEYKVREKKLKEELKEEKIEHSKVITTEEGIDYGCYIFHDKSTKKGRLESILIKILKESEKNLFSKAEKFIAENKFDSERTKEYCNKKNKYKGHCKFNEEKSKISILGQLQFSGMSNAVIISKSDFLKNDILFSFIETEEIKKLFL